MTDLTNNTPIQTVPATGAVDEVAAVETGANGVEAQPMTITNVADHPDLSYSATAADNGAAGNLDGQPGVVWNGAPGGYVRVKVSNFDLLEHAIAAPEATDRAALAVFKNSELQDFGDEGLSAHASEIAVEHNIDTLVGPLVAGDVIRVGITSTGEVGEVDYDLAPAEVSFT